MDNLTIRLAVSYEKNNILSLYKSVIGINGCTWNEFYPSSIEIDEDIKSGSLFVLVKENLIIGAVSIVPINELDEKSFWKINDGKQKELARVVISPLFQGKGYAGFMMNYILNYLNKQDCSAIHLLVAKGNLSAINLYKKLQFNFVGSCFMYENNYYACEKILYKDKK